jgi:hypothetical protein
MVLCSRKAQWCKMILASKHSYTFADNKTIQHENNYRILLFFNMSLLFAQNSKLTGIIAAKTTQKNCILNCCCFDATKSFVKSTATDEKDTMKFKSLM